MALTGQTLPIANAVERGNGQARSAGKCGQIYVGAISTRWRRRAASRQSINQLISNDYFLISLFRNCPLQARPGGEQNARGRNLAKSEAFLISPGENAVRQRQSVCIFT
jgi:hypothetical protein